MADGSNTQFSLNARVHVHGMHCYMYAHLCAWFVPTCIPQNKNMLFAQRDLLVPNSQLLCLWPVLSTSPTGSARLNFEPLQQGSQSSTVHSESAGVVLKAYAIHVFPQRVLSRRLLTGVADRTRREGAERGLRVEVRKAGILN